MQMQELVIQHREGTGKQAAKRLRRAGAVPAVLYGGTKPEAVSVDPRTVLRIIHGHGASTQLVSLKAPGDSGAARMAVIRDLQFDPVSEELLHVDLQEVAADRAITVMVAVHPLGEAAGVRDQKGILNLALHEIEVSCLPSEIPERIDADVSALMIGDVLTIADLRVPEGVRILNAPDQAVATVAPPMAEEAPPAAAPIAAVTAEPEVLTERKPKEEAPADEGRKAKK
jgi:large subunit ribosomal protein L25